MKRDDGNVSEKSIISDNFLSIASSFVFCFSQGVGLFPSQDQIQQLMPPWIYNDSLVPGNIIHEVPKELSRHGRKSKIQCELLPQVHTAIDTLQKDKGWGGRNETRLISLST